MTGYPSEKKKRTWFFLASQLFVFFLLPPGSFLTSPVFWLFRVTPPFSGKKEKGKVTKKIGNTNSRTQDTFPFKLVTSPSFSRKIHITSTPQIFNMEPENDGFFKRNLLFPVYFFQLPAVKTSGV